MLGFIRNVLKRLGVGIGLMLFLVAVLTMCVFATLVAPFQWLLTGKTMFTYDPKDSYHEWN